MNNHNGFHGEGNIQGCGYVYDTIVATQPPSVGWNFLLMIFVYYSLFSSTASPATFNSGAGYNNHPPSFPQESAFGFMQTPPAPTQGGSMGPPVPLAQYKTPPTNENLSSLMG